MADLLLRLLALHAATHGRTVSRNRAVALWIGAGHPAGEFVAALAELVRRGVVEHSYSTDTIFVW